MKITNEIAKEILALNGAAKQKEIAERFGISTARVSQIMRGGQVLTPEQRSEAARKRAANSQVGRKRVIDYDAVRGMAEDSLTYKEIAEHLGCSVGSVSRILAE